MGTLHAMIDEDDRIKNRLTGTTQVGLPLNKLVFLFMNRKNALFILIA